MTISLQMRGTNFRQNFEPALNCVNQIGNVPKILILR